VLYNSKVTCLCNSNALDRIIAVRNLKQFVVLQVDYIHVLEMTRDNLCTVVGLMDMICDFKELWLIYA